MTMNKVTNIHDNTLVVNFGKGVVVNIGDYGDNNEVVKIQFKNQFHEPVVGDNGVASVKQVNDFTATLYLNLKPESDENKYFEKWVANVRHEEADMIQATLNNKTLGRKVTLTNGVVISQPTISLGNRHSVEWVVEFMDSKIEMEN